MKVNDLISRKLALYRISDLVPTAEGGLIMKALCLATLSSPRILPSIEIKDQTAETEKVDMPNPKNLVYRCLNCGQYMHKTIWGKPIKYCPHCGRRLEWK